MALPPAVELRTARRDSGESAEEVKDKTVEKRGWRVAPRLRALAALEEHPNSVLSPPPLPWWQQLTAVRNSSFGGFCGLQAGMGCTYVQKQ